MEIYQSTDNNIFNLNTAVKNNNNNNNNNNHNPIKTFTAILGITVAVYTTTINTNVKESNASFTRSSLNNIKNKSIGNYNLSENDRISLNERISVSSNRNKIWSFNNKKMEVDELVEKVSQAQLNEVKDHFDTKISSLKNDIETMFKDQEIKRLSEKIELIDNAKKNKKETIRWFIGTALALTGLVFTIMKYFN